MAAPAIMHSVFVITSLRIRRMEKTADGCRSAETSERVARSREASRSTCRSAMGLAAPTGGVVASRPERARLRCGYCAKHQSLYSTRPGPQVFAGAATGAGGGVLLP